MGFRLGDHLKVRLINVIIDERKIDFELAERPRASAAGAPSVAAGQASRRRPAGTQGVQAIVTETAVVFGLHAVQAALENQASRVAGVLLQRGRGDARIDAIEQLARSRNQRRTARRP